MREIKIGLLGSGTVGTGVITVLQMNKALIEQRIGAKLTLEKILVRPEDMSRPILKGLNTTFDLDDILNDPSIEIVIELIGGTKVAKDFQLRVINAGKHVVTANKDLIAQFGDEIFDAVERNKIDYLFEAAVGGGIPIIMPLRRCLTANRLTEVLGIVNGTTNYMLSHMAEDGADYDTVLKEAQALGYAEANPTSDVEGLDAARKAAILASLAFNARVQLKDVYVEGITKITTADIDYAKSLGYVVKLLAVGKETDLGIDVRVHPAFLPKDHPLASVNGVFNAIFVRGNSIGEAMFFGPGAGGVPTASAVISDIIEVARGIVNGSKGRFTIDFKADKPLCPIEETTSSYYIRLLVDDKPGVLGSIAMTFGDAGVSLKSVVQTNADRDEHAEIVVITHGVKHKAVLNAVERLKKLPAVDDVLGLIRVHNEDEGKGND